MKNLFLFLFLFLGKMFVAQKPNYRVELSVSVDNLNIRTEPNVNSQVIRQLPKYDGLIWLNEMTSKDEIVKWKGKDEKGRWFKVRSFNQGTNCVGWIFEKGVNVKEINLRYDEIKEQDIVFDSSIPFENYWIKIEPSSEKAFLSLSNLNYFKENKNIKKNKKDSTLIFPLHNGKRIIKKDGFYTYYDEETDSNYTNYEIFEYIGDNQDFYFYKKYIPEKKLKESPKYHTIGFINKQNGSEPYIFGNNLYYDNPNNVRSEKYNFSPKIKGIVFPLTYDPGGMFGFTFLRLENAVNNSAAIFGFNSLKEFRWIDDNSGIASYYDNKNEPKLIYAKFIFKKM